MLVVILGVVVAAATSAVVTITVCGVACHAVVS